jgi:hypothetical protein
MKKGIVPPFASPPIEQRRGRSKKDHLEWKGDKTMGFYEAIERRRTIRKFKAPATEEQIMRIIVAGTKAHSGGN